MEIAPISIGLPSDQCRSFNTSALNVRSYWPNVDGILLPEFQSPAKAPALQGYRQVGVGPAVVALGALPPNLPFIPRIAPGRKPSLVLANLLERHP